MKISGNKIILRFKSQAMDWLVMMVNRLPILPLPVPMANLLPPAAIIKGNTVEVSAMIALASPVAARFAWSESAQPNFYNKNGLPAAPFRTDNPLKFTP
jgi:sialate O-acetylesterase